MYHQVVKIHECSRGAAIKIMVHNGQAVPCAFTALAVK